MNCADGGNCGRSRSRGRDSDDNDAPKWALTLMMKMDRVSGQVDDIQQKVEQAVRTSEEAKSETVKNKETLDRVSSSVALLKGEVDNIKGPGLESAVRKVIDERLPVLGGTAATPFYGPQSSNVTSRLVSSEFVPTKVFVRGWAPIGSERTDMIGRKEYADKAKQMIEKLPVHFQPNVSVENPGPYNFQIAFKVKGGRLGCEQIRETLNSIFERDDFTVKGVQVKASIEPSPDRRAKYRIYQTNLKALKDFLNPDAYDVDERFLKIFNVQDASIVGEFQKGTSMWEWKDDVLRKMGVDKKLLMDKVAE